ncbi:MAG TPA: hypothetical protein VLT60_00540 [Usitatibacter sp.]|nr:hypothetical protein [Usitatibacter sp.]
MTKAQWHAEGLRWIASLLESMARRLEAGQAEPLGDCDRPDCVEKTRLRAHLRGL